jgi:hypothetical protein
MSEIDVINERLQRGDQRFSEIIGALSDVKAHLKNQDATMARLEAKVDKVDQGTQDVVSMWNGGVKAVRFFCRMAEAWRFLMRQVVLPIGFPLTTIYGIWYVHQHGELPTWLVAVFKFITQVF